MDDAQAQQTNPLFGIIPKEFFTPLASPNRPIHYLVLFQKNFSHRWHRRTDLYIGTVCAGCFKQ